MQIHGRKRQNENFTCPRYYKKKTDEQHPLNSTQIAAQLKLYGIDAERKAIGRDLECLERAGYDIIKCENHNMGWYMTGQDFQDHEVKMLADAVAAAKFLTAEDSRALIKKIKNLATKEGEKIIDATLIMDSGLKINDKQFNLKFDAIMRAITERKQLRFQYYEYAKDKEKALKRNGHVYQVSPYFIVLSNEEYFLIANPSSHNHVTHFRIEMITGLTVFNEPVRPMSEIDELHGIGHSKNIADYLRENVNMWVGENTVVTLRATKGCKQDVMLKFGRNIDLHDVDAEHFIAHIRVANSKGFYFWLAAHGSYMQIVEPESVKQDFVRFLKSALENYK